ncbi:antibiotic biosynthesis monooxygenase [Streptomyces sp. CB02366]|nr:antibiotic biosynthesis monooxygenase [Streptomyces sp. CB02366]
MARRHDRPPVGQSGMFRDMRVTLFERRFDVKTGFEPHFAGADVVRVAHSRVREERAEHFVLMQQQVWNPAMAGSPGMLRGVFAEAPGNEFLALSLWQSSAERGKYRAAGAERLAARAQTETDVIELTGDVVELEPSWTV